MPGFPSTTATAVMSVPRYGNHLCRSAVEGALRGLNLELKLYSGPYWHHVLSRVFEEAVYKDNYDWILCFDHDTMVTTTDIVRLLSHAEDNKLDALAALQCTRGNDLPLFSQEGFHGLVGGHVGKSIIEVETAHFGCTAIRCESLKRTIQPWFWELPSRLGTWGPPIGKEVEYRVHPAVEAAYKWCSGGNKIDADIWFWKNFISSGGNKVWIDGSVRIGHMEEIVSFYDEHGRIQRVHDTEWWKMQEEAASH